MEGCHGYVFVRFESRHRPLNLIKSQLQNLEMKTLIQLLKNSIKQKKKNRHDELRHSGPFYTYSTFVGRSLKPRLSWTGEWTTNAHEKNLKLSWARGACWRRSSTHFTGLFIFCSKMILNFTPTSTIAPKALKLRQRPRGVRDTHLVDGWFRVKNGFIPWRLWMMSETPCLKGQWCLIRWHNRLPSYIFTRKGDNVHSFCFSQLLPMILLKVF